LRQLDDDRVLLVAPLPKRRILVHPDRAVQRADDLSIVLVHKYEPPTEVFLSSRSRLFGIRGGLPQLGVGVGVGGSVAVDVGGVSDEHAVEELDVVRSLGSHGELDA
jgi:hypothetical protein